jgi:hypothetical protein
MMVKGIFTSVPVVRVSAPAGQQLAPLGAASFACINRISRFQAAGLSWPLPEELTDAALEARLLAKAGTKAGSSASGRVRLYQLIVMVRSNSMPVPDWRGLYL